MALRLGDLAPDFTAETTEGTIKFHEWLGNSWGILFSHPRDYTPVCTTELGAVARTKGEFDKRNVKVIAVSVDPLADHKGWIGDINETQNTTMNFPIIADPKREVASLLTDMISFPNAALIPSRCVPFSSWDRTRRSNSHSRIRPRRDATSWN